DLVRDVLGCDGRRCQLAGRRRRPACAGPRDARRLSGDRGHAPPPTAPRLSGRRTRGGGAGMRRLEAFLRFLWDFVVGDDWRIAAGVVVALGITALVADTSLAAWWILPVAVIVLLGASVWHAARSARST